MSRRVSLPGADLLFRPTRDAAPTGGTPGEPTGSAGQPEPVPTHQAPVQPAPVQQAPPEPSPPRQQRRRRHDEKITVYVSEEQLLELEQARLRLRAEYGLAVDRGRIVREAVAAALAELDERGTGSTLVQRLVAEEP